MLWNLAVPLKAIQLKLVYTQTSSELIPVENHWNFICIVSYISLSLCYEELLALLQPFNKLLPHSIGVKFRHFVTHPTALILRTHLTPRSPPGTCCGGWLSTVRDRAAIQHVRQFNWPHQHHPTTAAGIRNPYGILYPTPSLRQNFTVNIILPRVKIATRRRSGIVSKKN